MAAPSAESARRENREISGGNPVFSATSRVPGPRGAFPGPTDALLAVVVAVVAALLAGSLGRFGGTICWRDFRTGSSACRPRCANGTFGLPGMNACVPWLTCAEIGGVELGQGIGGGAVKQVRMGFWKEHTVAVATPVTVDYTALYREDFESGLSTLVALGPNDHLVQLVGLCREPLVLVTEYHRMGSAALALEHLRHRDSAAARLQLCADYAAILRWLHDGGPRVMCDSSSLAKTLQQYLLTDDMRLRLNDADALPLVTDELVRCGDRPLDGEFVAPEQRWSGHGPMPRYDHRTDVWKIPDVCSHFLAGAKELDLMRFHLFSIHKRCKAVDPAHRPTAAEVLATYMEVLKSFET